MSECSETLSVPERLQRLDQLTEFVQNCRKQLNDVFETLGWSADHEPEPMGQCPFDPGHRVPLRTLDKHKAWCRLRTSGYSAQEQAQMLDPSVCYQNTCVRTFTMDEATQHQVILQARSAAPLMRMEGVFWQGQFSGRPAPVPQNHQRAVCDLTVADRLALYEHVVGVLGRETDGAGLSNDDLYVDLVSKLQRDDKPQEQKSYLEVMAEMRDYKRRRQSYRAKNVHITKKSYTEVIREVIGVHSQELARQWREDEEEEEEEESERPPHRRSHQGRSQEGRSQEGHQGRSQEGRSQEGRSQEGHRGRSQEGRSQEGHRGRSQEGRSQEGRSQEGHQGRGQEGSRGRSQERSQGRSQEGHQGRSQERSRGRSQERNQGRSRERSRGRSQERSRGRSQERNQGRSRERSQGRGQEQRWGRGQEGSQRRSLERSQGRGQEGLQGQSQEQRRGRSQERSLQQKRGRSREQSEGRSRERSQGRSQERESKKKKKRERERSSPSRHHHKKKSKKKKEEKRDKQRS